MIKLLCRSTRCAVFAAAVSGSLPTAAATITVTPATLATAFKNAASGDTLRLVGSFGLTRLQNRSFTSNLTLDARRAVFTDTLDLQNINNIKVVGGRWDVTKGSTYGRGIVVYGGTNVTVDRVTVVGVAGQQGVNFAGTSHATVSNSSFSGLQVGIGMTGLTGGLATHNRITRAVADGIDIGDSHGVTASYNSCSGSVPGPGAHPDCIQLWSTTGHPVQSDNIVTHNSATGMTQGFTSFSLGGGALRVQITNNIVNTSMSQGVACYDCFDSIISYNTLTTLHGAQHLTNLNIFGGGNNQVVGNIVNPAPFLRRNAGALVEPAFAAFTDTLPPPAPAALGDFSIAGDASAAAVPEPASWTMLIAGFAAVGQLARRRTRTACA